MPKFLRNAALWVRDWVRAAMHDPDFWMMRPFSLGCPHLEILPLYRALRITVSWHDCPRLRLNCPSDWNEWGPTPRIDYAYFSNRAIDYDNIPF